MPETLIVHETVASTAARSHEEWDPDWIGYVFSTWVKCGHPSCGELVTISGTGGEEPSFTDDEGFSYETYFSPQYCSHMPDVFGLPSKCPPEVAKELRAAFALFWQDQAASANRVRIALESLLTSLGIARVKTTAKGKQVKLYLHERIELFEKGEPTIAAQLMALKWLGNTGSHVGTVNKDDLLDAFEVLEHSLEEVIGKRSARIAALTAKLNAKHKPR